MNFKMNFDDLINLFNSKEIANNADVVFQKLPNNNYVEIENRQRPISDHVYELDEIKKFKSYEIIETTYVIR
jgi:hypothetical protein